MWGAAYDVAQEFLTVFGREFRSPMVLAAAGRCHGSHLSERKCYGNSEDLYAENG